MAQSDLDLLDNELAEVLSDALGNGNTVVGLVQGLTICADMAERHCVGREIACTRGCPHCCVLNVSVLLPEALRIAETINTEWPETAWSALQERLVHHCNWARWMDDEERLMRGAFCPLLDTKGNCSIHTVRPLVCRGVASLDSISCRRAFDPIIDEHDRSQPICSGKLPMIRPLWRWGGLSSSMAWTTGVLSSASASWRLLKTRNSRPCISPEAGSPANSGDRSPDHDGL